MGSSIQDYLKKINSRITLLDCISLFVTAIFLLSFILFLYIQKEKNYIPVTYIENKEEINNEKADIYSDSRPFASTNGKTYTFSWCQGANMISSKNKIYFNTEDDAKNNGRTLSKLCQK